MSPLIRRPAIVILFISPLVVFTGAPSLVPDFLLAYWLGVPGTVWATVLWFIGTVMLTWRFANSAELDKATGRDQPADGGTH